MNSIDLMKVYNNVSSSDYELKNWLKSLNDFQLCVLYCKIDKDDDRKKLLLRYIK